ncbi:hypothetical protein DSM100688_0682 [Bifidobacterium ramosum]|uniref:Uncharacterized protein n=1 Tax=Bifidobacterium ramosum TaxID=1798158 RepID=A0A6L4X278_9BIFI|nr:hypothetical protein [Bifidobacterium ramosum]KAB8288680.1 hypothetical protein DSM100688_0682 [Bifidobacterium ramosum]NEG71457.1 hypothetical protein [Bifidobacterium ramosum]
MSNASDIRGTDINNQIDDLSEDELINDKPLKRIVLAGLALLAVSVFLPGSRYTLHLPVREVVTAAGAWMMVLPLLVVAWHQFRTKRHFPIVTHFALPIVGLVMVAARIVLVPMGASTIFLNLWSIGGTFLVVPLVQQLIELLSGSVDMETGGNQIRYQ